MHKHLGTLVRLIDAVQKRDDMVRFGNRKLPKIVAMSLDRVKSSSANAQENRGCVSDAGSQSAELTFNERTRRRKTE